MALLPDSQGRNARVGMQLAPNAQKALDLELRRRGQKGLPRVHIEPAVADVLDHAVASAKVFGQVAADPAFVVCDPHEPSPILLLAQSDGACKAPLRDTSERDHREVGARGDEFEGELILVEELCKGAQLVTAMVELVEAEIGAGTKRPSASWVNSTLSELHVGRPTFG